MSALGKAWKDPVAAPARFGRWVLTATVLAAAGAACGDDGVSGPDDNLAPQVTIVEPEDEAIVTVSRPEFRIQANDGGSGIFCSSVEATINGVNYDQFFRNGCTESTGEIHVRAGEIIPALGDGGRTLVFTISDQAGNETTVTRTFIVDTAGDGEPPQ